MGVDQSDWSVDWSRLELSAHLDPHPLPADAALFLNEAAERRVHEKCCTAGATCRNRALVLYHADAQHVV